MRLLWLTALFFLGGSAFAQEPGRVYRLGVVSPSPRSLESFRDMAVPELARLGFVDGQNLRLEMRTGQAGEMPALVEGLVAQKPDAIIAVSSGVAALSRKASSTIPIILYGGDDPVALGLAATFAKPGANVTGITIMGVVLDAKRLELLHEAVPQARRVAALVVPGSPTREASEREMRAVAGKSGIELSIYPASEPADYELAFAAMHAAGAEALAITAHASLFANAPELIRLARDARLPTICEWREMAELGCVLRYGPSRKALFGRVADYAVRILRGANPGELPIEQPTKFELVVNSKAAKGLGIEVPPSLLARADEVIE